MNTGGSKYIPADTSRTGAKYLEPLTDLAISLYNNWNCTTFENEFLALTTLQNQKGKQYNVNYEYYQNTDNQAQNQQTASPQQPSITNQQNDPTSFASTIQALNQLMSEDKPVDSNSQDAKVRETTILTPSGERIELNEDLIKKPDSIKK